MENQGASTAFPDALKSTRVQSQSHGLLRPKLLGRVLRRQQEEPHAARPETWVRVYCSYRQMHFVSALTLAIFCMWVPSPRRSEVCIRSSCSVPSLGFCLLTCVPFFLREDENTINGAGPAPSSIPRRHCVLSTMVLTCQRLSPVLCTVGILTAQRGGSTLTVVTSVAEPNLKVAYFHPPRLP